MTLTTDVALAVRSSDVSFVCVGTPSLGNGSQDLRALERLGVELGAALQSKGEYHVIVIRSTVLPGTVDELVGPILESHSGRVRGRDFDVCFQPEFLREGSSIRDYDNPPFTVVGADRERPIAVLREVFGHLPGRFMPCPIRTAEMLKYACNTFHALKITFANEMGRICQAMNIESHEVMDLVCQDTQLNISPAYLRPGFAYGGSCLPKDLRALRYAASRRDVLVPMLDQIERSNQLHIDHAVDMVLSTGLRSVGLLGLSFKSGTDDLRESPLVVMAERFIGKGLRLLIHDPEVSVARLVGANRRYIEETIPHISSLMQPTAEDVVRNASVLVVAHRNAPALDALYRCTTDEHVIIDLVNVPNRERLKGAYHGVCW